VTVEAKAPGRMQLRIDRLLPTDSGRYVCSSVNDIGQHNSSANITVLCEYSSNTPRLPYDIPLPA